MTNETSQTEQQPPWMKTPEQEINSENIWEGDALGRKEMAENVASIIADPRGLSTISIHGGWGTGKTFFLSRLSWHLRKEGFEAIYFNAWQDDFLHDPLLAILGQLAGDLRGTKLQELGTAALETGGRLIRRIPAAVVEKIAGSRMAEGLDSEPSLFDMYEENVKTREELKQKLCDMAKRVAAEREDRPLVFIIDELDRCRPTFAIELMERVKHIFEVPNLLFIFGINRDEMAKSLKSVYGDIDGDTYLRRFFDLELSLPPADLARFTRHLIDKYRLPAFFSGELADIPEVEISFRHIHDYLPMLVGLTNSSLRGAHNCIRLLSMVARQLKGRQGIQSVEIVTLIFLKEQNRDLFYRFLEGDARAREVIDWLSDYLLNRQLDEQERDILFSVLRSTEPNLYRADIVRSKTRGDRNGITTELRALAEGNAPENYEFLSNRIEQWNEHKARQMLEWLRHYGDSTYDRIGEAAKMIELSAQYIRE